MSYQVLVAENDPDQLEMFTEVLRDAGLIVHAASTAIEAAGVLHATSIDLLIADVRLSPYMNGFELANLAQSLQPSLRVMFMTGFIEAIACRQPAAIKGAHILFKPFSLTEFVSAARSRLKCLPNGFNDANQHFAMPVYG
jgi:CheY-like chemotaxis protein